jgi:lysophospholipase L1-like esterase
VLGAGRSPPGTARRARAVGVAVLVAIVLAAGAWSAGTRQAALREARRLAARDVAGPLERAPFRLAEPVTLDLGNALELPGTRRDLDLRARVTLGRGALLELRLHAPEREQALGVAFCAGDVGRYGARFCRLDSLDFEPLGEGASSVPVGRPFDLLVRVRDGRYVAWIDGARVAQAECRGFPAGSGFVLAAAGSVQVESLQLDAVDVPGASPVPRRAGWTWAAAALAGFAALGLLATWPLRQAAWHAFESTAFAWAPLALLLHGTGAEPDRADLVLVAGAAALLVLVHPASTRADAARPDAARPDAAQPDAARPDAVRPAAGRPALFVLAGLAIVLGPVLVLAVPRDAARRPELTHDHVFPGPRLTPGLVAFEHPAIRFLNRWLRAHRLRGSRFPLRAPPGTVRVLAAGSSSTWGHGLDEDGGLDYPTVLGGLLRERVPGVAIEALNGAIPGTSSARHLRFFRECLLAYGPDVVTLCFTFNDSHNATYLDEHPYLDAIASPDYEHDTAARREAAEAADAGNRKLKRLLAAFAAQGPPTAPLWDAIDDDPHARPPPERFLSTLRAWARLCAERGIALVLIKEPLRNDRPLPWKEEFRAAIDAVAAEYSLPVVDPTPALLAEERAGTMFMDDVHPTPAGHAVIAREVADAVEALVRRIAAER